MLSGGITNSGDGAVSSRLNLHMGNTKSLDSVQISGSGAVIQQSRKLPGSQKYALLEDRMAKSDRKEVLNVVMLYIIGGNFLSSSQFAIFYQSKTKFNCFNCCK